MDFLKRISLFAFMLLAVGSLAFAGEPPVANRDKSGLPPGVSHDWWSTIQQNLREEEYQISPAFSGKNALYQAPNRAQGFRSLFSEKGVRVVPRTEEKPSWEWGLELVQKAEGGRLKAEVTATGNRIEIDRGDIKEWYVNSPEGLEQGFTVNTPLDNTGKLHIDIKLTGNLRPKFAEDGQAIDFYGSGSLSVLNYSKLKATDAGGTILPSRFEGINGGIRIVVEDTGALYPVTIDPLAATPAWTAESDQTGTEFGYSVGTAGDVNGDGYSDVIVGAYGYDNGQVHEGRAYVYLGGPSGLSANAAWTAEGDQQGAEFGTRVGTAGDVNGDGYSDVIVGAPGYDNGQANEGRVYVYLGGLSGLSACAAWTAESDQDYVNFGVSVGTAGDVNGDGYSDVIVGANNYSNGQTYEGRAYVYLGGPSGLSVSAGWTAESDQTEAHFGDSVGTAGDVNGDGYSDVIVGADWYDNGQANEGRAYVYLGGPSGLTASAGWTAEGDQEQAYFGNSVGTAGDVNGDGYSDVIVGAMFYDNGQADEGRAYVYLGGPSGLSATTGWTAEGNQESALFGIFVGTAGDVNGDGYSDIIVGAYGYDNGQANEGRAYVYLGGPGGISATAEWTAESDQEDTAFGRSVGTAGDVNGDGFSDVIVGAPWFGNGRAYVYLGGPSGIPASAGWTAESGQANANFGYSVGTAGDVNGDGYSDVIVGADRYSNGQYEEGRAYVYLGGPSGLSTSAVWTAESEQAVAHFGQSVGTAGDVNGDGYSDVIVGAENYQNGQVGEGRAYVYLGGPAGLADSAAWTTEGDQDYAYFGQSVGTAGDVNGDGYSDVIVGAFGYTNGQVGEGRAYVYLGGPDGLSANAAWTAEGDQEGAQFGYSVGTAGDVNGDGYSDVIVGAYDYDNGQTNEGRAYVYPGGPAGPSASAGWTAESDQDYAWFGYSVGTAGDVNGDGYSDVIVGAYNYDKGQTNEGRAYVYTGGPSGLSSDAAWTAEGDQEQAYFGNSVGTAGDVNGDGYSDIIVGAYYYDNGQTNEGRAYVFTGGPSGLPASACWTAESDREGALFGVSVETAGDVNGDGYSDLLVGAYGYSGYTGKAYLYQGNGGQGVPVIPRQLRIDRSAPVAPLGRAGDGMFAIAALGRTPFGRSEVKLEWQVAPLRGTFNVNLNPVQAQYGWTDSGISGAGLSRSLLLVDGDGPYIWRIRTRYNPGSSPFQGHGRWLTLTDNGLKETDIRRTSGSAACVEPDEPCWIYLVTTDGANHTLNWQDPNQENQRTGWNVRRSDDPSVVPKSSWPVVCSNCVDMDAGTVNYQWTDSSGDTSPSGVWYYLVTTYNDNCPAEGPFSSE